MYIGTTFLVGLLYIKFESIFESYRDLAGPPIGDSSVSKGCMFEDVHGITV